MAGTALLVSNEYKVKEKITTVFEFIDFSVDVADSLIEASTILGDGRELVIALIAVADTELCAEFVLLINKLKPALPVFILDLDSTEKTSIPKGVSGYISYPVQYRTLLGIIRNAEKQGRSSSRSNEPSVSLTGNSSQLREIQALIRHVALTDANVLLLGES